jgi:hypothetical protein
MRRLVGNLLLVATWLVPMTTAVWVLHFWSGQGVFKVLLASAGAIAAAEELIDLTRRLPDHAHYQKTSA